MNVDPETYRTRQNFIGADRMIPMTAQMIYAKTALKIFNPETRK